MMIHGLKYQHTEIKVLVLMLVFLNQSFFNNPKIL